MQSSAAQINIADALLSILADWGVRSIFGVSGDAIFPLLDAISRQNRIKYYAAASETGAAFMASYQAKLTGQPGVCIGTSGPGVANMLNGLADAYFDRAPVIAITGQVETKKIGTNAKQYINQQQLIKTFAQMSEPIVNPGALVPVLTRAWETAVNNKTVVHLSIPKDIFQMPAILKTLPQVSGRSQIIGSGFATGLEDVVTQLNNSQRPIIIFGQRNRETGRLILELADKIGAGIIVAQQAKGIIPDRHPLVIGGIGEAYIPGVINKADSFLLIGDASFDLKFLPTEISIIQLAELPDILSFDRINKGIVGNIGQIVKLLIERIRVKPHHNKSWVEEIMGEKKAFLQTLHDAGRNNEIPIHPARLIAALNNTVDEDSVINCDLGSFTHWFDRGFLAEEQTILLSSHWRSIGIGIPAAIGAKISAPEKQVVALVGDGGFIISLAEIMTALKYQLPITIVVANNHQYGLEKHRMMAYGMNSLGNDILVPDFAGYARAYGAKGFMVKDPTNLETVLEEAFGCGQVAILDVRLADVPLPVYSRKA